MPKLAFISYRRTDAAHAAQAIYAQLRSRFGPSNVFMDVNTVSPGIEWPERIHQALKDATTMIAMIGPSWLTTADKYGRRRLDDKSDWVRKEITCALLAKIPIIPVLIGGLQTPPEKEGLPKALVALSQRQALPIREENWDRDFNALVEELVTKHGFRENQQPVRLPTPAVQTVPLSPTELESALADLPGWEPVESLVPGNYPKSRHELCKAFEFSSFSEAIAFMQEAVSRINKHNHHPRWENQWKTVTIWLTTWDIGNRISKLDLQLAHEIDQEFLRFRRWAKKGSPLF